jgi:hypothetical protein
MRPLYLDWNLGLGDAIICDGLVRALAESGRKITLPAWPRNLESVANMFADLPNVEVIEANGDGLPDRPGEEIISIGLRGPVYPDSYKESFDQHFYRRAGLPWEYRYSKFKLPPNNPQRKVPTFPFALIHGKASDGSRISKENIDSDIFQLRVEDHLDSPLAAWVDTIAAAAEIHCLDSSFVHLVESVPSTNNLFFHAYARPCFFQLRKPWSILK